MVTAPHIIVYEVFEDKPSVELGKLLSPDQFYALAAGMSWVEHDLLHIDGEDIVRKLSAIYKKCGNALPAETVEYFTWFCQTCADMGKIIQDLSWQFQPGDFTKHSRAFLCLLFFTSARLDSESAKIGRLILRLIDQLLQHEVEHWDDPIPWPARVIRAVLFPVSIIVRRKQPGCFDRFDKAMAGKAREAIQRVLKVCEMAADEKRVISFDPPEDQFDKSLELDGLRTRTRKGGGVQFG